MLKTLFAFLASLPVLSNGQSESFTISLRGGNDVNEGYIVTSQGNIEGRICDTMWDDLDAAVACRQLGLGNSGKAYVDSENFIFVGWQGDVRYRDFQCTGNEENLSECDYKLVVVKAKDCPGGYVAGLRCYKDYDLRLTDSDKAGRLEIYISGEWTTVCDKGWDDADAVVVCRQLTGRYEQNRAVAIGQALYGEGTGPVGFANFRCNGTESFISECPYTAEPDPEVCSHSRDAGVDCNGDACSSQPCQNNGRCQITSIGNRVCTCQEGYEGEFCEDTASNRFKPGSTASTYKLGIVIIITLVVCLAILFLFLLISFMIMKVVNREVEKNVVVVIPTAPSMEDMEMNEEGYDEDKFEETKSYHTEADDENRWNEEQINDYD